MSELCRANKMLMCNIQVKMRLNPNWPEVFFAELRMQTCVSRAIPQSDSLSHEKAVG